MNNMMIIVVYVILLTLLFLPLWLSNRKKRNQFNEMMKDLKIGDKIVSIGGIHADIVKILDTTVEVRISKGISMTLSKSAISKVVK